MTWWWYPVGVKDPSVLGDKVVMGWGRVDSGSL